MFEYFVACCFLVTVVTGVCYAVCRARRLETMKALDRALIAACVSALLVPTVPYTWVAAHTSLYASDFVSAKRVWIGVGAKVEYVRVFHVTPRRAKVFFVERTILERDSGTPRSYRAGCLFWFRRDKRGRWQSVEDWDCVWSEMGSAHGTTFPPFW
jgi:hypothetical protein